MEKIALDTTFLIDLQNERRARGKSRGATAFLRAHATSELLLPVVALAQYLEGFEDPGGQDARSLIASLDVLDVTAQVAALYAATVRELRKAGRLIGTNDLWIACTAKVASLPLLTRNVADFRRVPGLQVIGYGV
jgi:tRNA(fMet)-specific endonuclease VapC